MYTGKLLVDGFFKERLASAEENNNRGKLLYVVATMYQALSQASHLADTVCLIIKIAQCQRCLSSPTFQMVKLRRGDYVACLRKFNQ